MEYNLVMNGRIQARIDTTLLEEVDQILKKLGITTTELMRMTFRQVAMKKGLPFEVKIPNKETVTALKEAKEHPERLLTYSSVDEAFDDMWQ